MNIYLQKLMETDNIAELLRLYHVDEVIKGSLDGEICDFSPSKLDSLFISPTSLRRPTIILNPIKNNRLTTLGKIAIISRFYCRDLEFKKYVEGMLISQNWTKTIEYCNESFVYRVNGEQYVYKWHFRQK